MSSQTLNASVSVVIPTFNSEETIERTVNSVLKQQGDYVKEIVFVDDASSDATVDKLKAFKHPTIKFIIHPFIENQGAAATRNKAIELCSGRFIAFLDSDDQWRENKLQRQLTFMQDKQYPVSCTYYQYDSGFIQKPLSEGVSFKQLCREKVIGCSTVCIDTEQVEKMDVKFPPIRKRQDYGLWLFLVKKYGDVGVVSEALVDYSTVAGSLSSNKLSLLKYNFLVHYKYGGFNVIQSFVNLVWNVCNAFQKKF